MNSTPTPSDGPMLDSESPEETSDPVVAPPVVAVVVTKDPGPWLEEGLSALGASDYPGLTTLVLDAGSGEDPTARVAGVLPGAFVRRLPEAEGFAAAANDVIEVVKGATFILFCHDDVVVDPSAIRLLVEEAFRSNAAIIGPKLVDYENPEVLLEVGMAIDRFGVPHSGIEPGELDQEQHDSVRDVFFVSSTVMLVRGGPLRRARRVRCPDVPRCRGSRPLLEGAHRRRTGHGRARRSGATPPGGQGPRHGGCRVTGDPSALPPACDVEVGVGVVARVPRAHSALPRGGRGRSVRALPAP